jgi:hypothetical protein
MQIATAELPADTAQPSGLVALTLVLGLLASWLGTLRSNEASQRLQTVLASQPIVFETLAALAFAFALRGALPSAATAGNIALPVNGVVWALRIRPEPSPEASAGVPR